MEPIRKSNGYPVKLALDFDGVLHSYDRWRGVVPTGEPIPGALEFVRWLIERGYEVFIMTTRAGHDGGVEGILGWLAVHGFPRLPITDTKHPADLYVDDRGFRFDGGFDKLRMFLNNNPVPGRWQRP